MSHKTNQQDEILALKAMINDYRNKIIKLLEEEKERLTLEVTFELLKIQMPRRDHSLKCNYNVFTRRVQMN